MFKNIPKQQIYTLAWNDNFIQEMIILTTELLIQDPVNKRWGIYKYDSNNKQYYYNDDSFYYINYSIKIIMEILLLKIDIILVDYSKVWGQYTITGIWH